MSNSSNDYHHKNLRRARKARSYERELKRILQGDILTLENVTKTCSKEEKEAYFKIRDRPFVMVRSAGSLGVDLVALRGEFAFPIEVKSSKNKKIRLAGSHQLKEQARKYKESCIKAGLLPIYAYRLSKIRGDFWRIFTLKDMKVRGAAGVIYRKLPKVHVSKDEYLILNWEEGWPLNKFIDYISFILKPV
jgi:Holliday junction resolvase